MQTASRGVNTSSGRSSGGLIREGGTSVQVTGQACVPGIVVRWLIFPSRTRKEEYAASRTPGAVRAARLYQQAR